MKKKRKILKGCVIKNKMKKSIVVSIIRMIKYPLYGKFIKRTTKFCVHDEKNLCNIGDLIEFYETKPYSKTKKWKFLRKIKKI